jgi:type III secretion protein L
MSRILKGAASAGTHRIEGAVFDAAQRAREIVAEAEAEARRILADVEPARARAAAEAVAAGHAEGLAEAAATVVRAAAERDRRLAALEGEVVALALDVARKILGRELSDPAAVVDLAARALAEARERREVTLRVSPADAPALRRAEGRLGALLARAPGLVMREDPALSPGHVVVETEAGRVDAGLDAQLAALERALREDR